MPRLNSSLATNPKPQLAWFKPFANLSICYSGIPLWGGRGVSQALANWLLRARLMSFPIVSARTKSTFCEFFTVHASGLLSCNNLSKDDLATFVHIIHFHPQLFHNH